MSDIIDARLDLEIDGQWITVSRLNHAGALRAAALIERAGIPVMISCTCGGYAYGECSGCNDQARGQQ